MTFNSPEYAAHQKQQERMGAINDINVQMAGIEQQLKVLGYAGILPENSDAMTEVRDAMGKVASGLQRTLINDGMAVAEDSRETEDN